MWALGGMFVVAAAQRSHDEREQSIAISVHTIEFVMAERGTVGNDTRSLRLGDTSKGALNRSHPERARRFQFYNKGHNAPRPFLVTIFRLARQWKTGV